MAGKERIFLEVARVLRKKVYVGAAKLRLLGCLGLPEEDMQWLTSNEQESHIHVVPLWTIASFKRMSFISKRYLVRI
jgi:DNA cross-link repair 1A protein